VEAFKPELGYEVVELVPILVYVPYEEVDRHILYPVGVPPEEGASHDMVTLTERAEDWAVAVTFLGTPGIGGPDWVHWA
jgi:hypothetical protein